MFYPNEVIDEVKSRSNIIDVVSQYVKLQKKGSSYFGCCPFHDEKTSSFSVSAEKQMYHCFGCGESGNVFNFLMSQENYSFQEAVQVLAERAGVQLPQEELTVEEKKLANLKNMILEVQREAALYFFYSLKQESGQKGQEYLHERGLTDETIRKFGLGYSNPYYNDLYQYLKRKGYRDDVLKESGLFHYEKGVTDRFWDRIMFPIMDINGKVIGFGGRVLGDAKPKYLNSPETKVFEKSRNLYGMHVAKNTKPDHFLVCEGYMDVIALHQAGFTNSVAALGTSFTSQHALLMKRYKKDAILTFDSDGAGLKATLRAIPILRSAGISVKVLDMKPYKDPDEFIKSLGAETYQERINQAMNGFMFEISVLKQSYDFADPHQKAVFVNECVKKLAAFTDEIERLTYTEAVADTYVIDAESLKRKVDYYSAENKKSVDEKAALKPAVEPGEKKEVLVSATILLDRLAAYYTKIEAVSMEYRQGKASEDEVYQALGAAKALYDVCCEAGLNPQLPEEKEVKKKSVRKIS